MRLSELETKRATALASLATMLAARDETAREFTDTEAAQFDALETEVTTLTSNIDREKKAENIRLQTAINKADKPTPETTAAKSFSFVKAIAGQLKGKQTGLEAELHQEAERELKAAGIHTGIEGVGLPAFALDIKGKNVYSGETRDLTAAGTATGLELVNNENKGNIGALSIAPKVFGLGATVLRGLTGNIYFTKTGNATATWEGENDANAETTPSTAKIELAPKRLGAFTDISKTLLTQTGNIAEMLVKFELEAAVSRALDLAAINGSGTGEPLGILGTVGINSVAMGTNGATPTRAKLIEMWLKIAEDNADIDTLAFLTSPGIKAYLMGLVVDAGSGRFVYENDAMVGYSSTTSNNVPTTLVKGTSGAACHAIILGLWKDLLIGQWGGIDLVVDPYSRSKENILTLVINTNWDVDVRHPESFCAIKDALVA